MRQVTVTAPRPTVPDVPGVVAAGSLGSAELLGALSVSAETGLSSAEVGLRQARWGPNAVSSHRARFLPVLWHQLRSPLLALLLSAALASYFVGEGTDAVIIAVIVGLSVGLGFVNEYRAEKAAEALHDQIHHETVVDPRRASGSCGCHGPCARRRGRRYAWVTSSRPMSGCWRSPAWSATSRCSRASRCLSTSTPTRRRRGRRWPSCPGARLMGTVVHAGSGRGVVVSTGARTEFGKIAAGLSTHQLDTEFQVGLRKFSMLLVYVAGSLTTVDLRHQRGAAQADHGRAAVLAGHRGRHHTRSCCPLLCPPASPPDHAG